jgi:hypothetical protein
MTADDGEATSLVAPREPWREPRIYAGDPAAALESLAQHPLWEGAPKPPAVAPAEAAPPASWRLSGILSDDGSPRAVILLMSGGRSPAQVQYRRVGDLLPDGSRISEISNTTITVESGDTQHSVRLFSRE